MMIFDGYSECNQRKRQNDRVSERVCVSVDHRLKNYFIGCRDAVFILNQHDFHKGPHDDNAKDKLKRRRRKKNCRSTSEKEIKVGRGKKSEGNSIEIFVFD